MDGSLAKGFSIWASLVAQTVKNLPAMQETQVQFLGQEDSLEKGMATHSSILAWRIPWTEKPGGLYSPWGHKELDMTKHKGERGAYYNYIYIYKTEGQSSFSLHKRPNCKHPLDHQKSKTVPEKHLFLLY